MKLINKFFICVLAVASPLAGCDTDALHDLNVNPQAVAEIDLNYIFTAAELGSAAGGSQVIIATSTGVRISDSVLMLFSNWQM